MSSRQPARFLPPRQKHQSRPLRQRLRVRARLSRFPQKTATRPEGENKDSTISAQLCFPVPAPAPPSQCRHCRHCLPHPPQPSPPPHPRRQHPPPPPRHPTHPPYHPPPP